MSSPAPTGDASISRRGTKAIGRKVCSDESTARSDRTDGTYARSVRLAQHVQAAN